MVRAENIVMEAAVNRAHVPATATIQLPFSNAEALRVRPEKERGSRICDMLIFVAGCWHWPTFSKSQVLLEIDIPY